MRSEIMKPTGESTDAPKCRVDALFIGDDEPTTIRDFLMAKPKGKQQTTTAEMIEAIAERIAARKPYGTLAVRFRPDLYRRSPEKAQSYLRSFKSKHKEKIDRSVQRKLKAK
jgi:hypothetical protein